MWQGSVIFISITPDGGGQMSAVDEAKAVAGQGVEGDRYFLKQGTFTDNPNTTGRQVTLVELEAIQALEREDGITIPAKDVRRNIVTRDVPLNHLVGREFRVGDVTLRGVRLNEPCNHLAGLTDDKVKQGLVHRGGLRADIVSDGVIRVGDVIEAV